MSKLGFLDDCVIHDGQAPEEEEPDETTAPAVEENYGSLLGVKAGKPKKRPVLVLDPDEAEQVARIVQDIAARQFAGEDVPHFESFWPQPAAEEAPAVQQWPEPVEAEPEVAAPTTEPERAIVESRAVEPATIEPEVAEQAALKAEIVEPAAIEPVAAPVHPDIAAMYRLPGSEPEPVALAAPEELAEPEPVAPVPAPVAAAPPPRARGHSLRKRIPEAKAQVSLASRVAALLRRLLGL